MHLQCSWDRALATATQMSPNAKQDTNIAIHAGLNLPLGMQD